jgi:hypothetical protein
VSFRSHQLVLCDHSTILCDRAEPWLAEESHPQLFNYHHQYIWQPLLQATPPNTTSSKMTFTYSSFSSSPSSLPSSSSLLDLQPRKSSFASSYTSCSSPSWPNRDCLQSAVPSEPTSYISDEDLFAPLEDLHDSRPATPELSTEEQIAMMQRIAEEQHINFMPSYRTEMRSNTQEQQKKEKRRSSSGKRRSSSKQMTPPNVRRV